MLVPQPRIKPMSPASEAQSLNHWFTREVAPVYYSSSSSLVAKLCSILATPWTVACQAPLSMGFSRQEYCSGLLLPSPGDLPDPGIKPGSPALQADSLQTELQGKPPPIY